MNKQEIEENTDTEINTDGSLRELEPALIETAHSLVKDDDVQAFIGDLSDPRIVMAIQLYQAAYEGMGTPHPTLAQLVEWLLEINADPEVYELEDRLNWIRGKLAEFGDVLADDMVEMPGRDILLLRIFSESP